MLDFAEPDLLETAARGRLEEALASGRAARVFERLIEAQGGDPRCVENPSLLPRPKSTVPALALRDGFVRAIATETDGFPLDRHRVRPPRAGRTRSTPPRASSSRRTIGDRVQRGEPLAHLCLGDRPAPRDTIARELADLFEIGDEPVSPPPLAIERL